MMKVTGMPVDPSWKKATHWKQRAYGGIIVNDKGQFLLREPAKHFDGYHWTWPKGKLDHENEHPAEAAHREVMEETGHKGRVFDSLPGTYSSGSGSTSNFYLMHSVVRHPELMDNETWRTRWAPFEEAKQMIGRSTNPGGRQRDLAILHLTKLFLDHKYGKKKTVTAAQVRIARIAAEATSYLEYFGNLAPISSVHPPSLARPLDVPIPLAQDGWKQGASAAKRKQALQDLLVIHERMRRQIGKPEVAQGVLNPWPN